MKFKIDKSNVTVSGNSCAANIRFTFPSKRAGTVRVGARIGKDYKGRCGVVDMNVEGTRAEPSDAEARLADRIVAVARRRLPKGRQFGRKRR